MTKRFVFVPKKLVLAAEDVERRFPASLAEWFVTQVDRVDVKALLARMGELEGAALFEFGKGLVSLQLFALLQALRSLPDGELADKVAMVLERRFRPEFVHSAWQIYEERLQGRVLRIIRTAVERGEDVAVRLGVAERWRDLFRQGLAGVDPEVTWARQLVERACDLQDACEGMRIRTGSLLHTRVLTRALTTASSGFLLAQRPGRLLAMLKTLQLDDLIVFAERYLTQLRMQDLDEQVMQCILHRLGDPERSLNWRKVDPRAVKQFLQWYFSFCLKTFFSGSRADPERLVFWERFVEQFTALKMQNSPPVLCMCLKEFAIIEFGERGNAAYVYSMETYKLYFEKFFTGTYTIRNTSDLKDRDLATEILHHHSGWQFRASSWLNTWLR